MDLIPLKFAAANLGLSTGYVRALCRAHRVPGALFDGRRWFVPESARVIRKTAGLYAVAAEPVSSETRKHAELAQRMQRLAAALSPPDAGAPPDGNDDDR